MLLQRVITAVLLLALLLPALLLDNLWPFAALTLLMVGAAGWEWGRLAGLGQGGALVLGAAVALACACAWQAGWATSAPASVWWLASACWVAGGAWALRLGPAGWSTLPRAVRVVAGGLMLTAAWLALVAAKQRGPGFILTSMCLVWAADIGAYFGGRTFGKRKLAPTISPGKSWEGVWSGMIAVALLAWGWLTLEAAWPPAGPSLFATLLASHGMALLIVGIVVLCGLSVVGDLLESLAKRAVGAKDSSRLLPGHGGVLDRIDALLPVLPAVMALTGA
jgi:phosphatidate cytidylyltransferase